MMRRVFRLLPLVALATVLATPDTAEARRGPVLITHGDSIKHIADLPAALREEARAEGKTPPAVGWVHEQFGVFWLDVWTWNGRLCLYTDEGYMDNIPPAALAELAGISESELKPPFLYHFPPGLMLIVGGVVVWGGAACRNNVRSKAEGRRIRELFEDGRYKRALEILGEHHARRQAAAAAAESAGQPAPEADPQDDGGFAAAVQHLVDSGIDRPDAERNLSTMLSLLAARNAA